MGSGLAKLINNSFFEKRNNLSFEELAEEIKRSFKSSRRDVSDLGNIIITEIKKRQKSKSLSNMNIREIDPQYQVILNDDTIYNPFVVDLDIILLVNKKIRGLTTEYEKAYAIYEWMEQNISYGDPRTIELRGYLSSTQTLKNRSGICMELAFLYVALARSAGLTAKIADVTKDYRGKITQHACAAVLIDSRILLADVAYHTFDVHHKEYRLLSDREVMSYI